MNKSEESKRVSVTPDQLYLLAQAVSAVAERYKNTAEQMQFNNIESLEVTGMKTVTERALVLLRGHANTCFKEFIASMDARMDAMLAVLIPLTIQPNRLVTDSRVNQIIQGSVDRAEFAEQTALADHATVAFHLADKWTAMDAGQCRATRQLAAQTCGAGFLQYASVGSCNAHLAFRLAAMCRKLNPALTIDYAHEISSISNVTESTFGKKSLTRVPPNVSPDNAPSPLFGNAAG